jgi:sensor histidine kinase YesM
VRLAVPKRYYPAAIIAALLIAAVLFYFFANFTFDLVYLLTIIWIGMLVLLLWYGNMAISGILDLKLPWSRYLSVRFFVQLVVSTIYALLCFNASYILFKTLFTSDPPTAGQLMAVNFYGILFTLPVFSIYYVVHFIREWKQSKIESEQLQKETIKSQLDSLKNHLDPHFLFNNLNILSSLIDKDQKGSQEYLNKFAEVYRYMLQNNSSDPILIKDELDFLTTYIDLIKTRFGEAVQVKQKLAEDAEFKQIPPLTLQMLVENCIKHNTMSIEKPLNIIIEADEEYLTVRNNLQGRPVGVASNKSGLKNIKNRYAFFTDKPVLVENNGNYFTVKVPILEIEEI